MGLLAEGGLGARGDSCPDHRYISPVVRIGIADTAFEAIATTLPLSANPDRRSKPLLFLNMAG
jgi:hypothetical protein